jgi:hypothetical protein
MRKQIFGFIAAAAVLVGTSSSFGAVIADWGFQIVTPADSTGTTSGPHNPDAGAGQALGVHASSATAWSTPAGNGSTESFSSNNWAVGDYYQFRVSTLGYEDITVSWHQTGSNTGPRDFTFQYSTNGTTFTNFLDYSITNDSWSSTGSPKSESIYTANLSAISALDDQANVYFRLTQRTTVAISSANPVATGGTGRVDNFVVNANLIPEPASLALLAIGGLGLLARRRRSC